MFYELLFEACTVLLLLSGIPLAAMAVTGLLVATLQAATQIQEQIVGFVAKWIVSLAFLFLAGPWAGDHLVHYLSTMLARLSQVRTL